MNVPSPGHPGRSRLLLAAALFGLTVAVGCSSVAGSPATTGATPTGPTTTGPTTTGPITPPQTPTSTAGQTATDIPTATGSPTTTGSPIITGGPTSRGGTGTEHPSGPPTGCPAGGSAAPVLNSQSFPILTVTPGTNAWIASRWTEPLALAVYPDGSGLVTTSLGAVSDPLPQFRLGRVSDCLLRWAESEIRAIAALDLGNPGVTDQGTTVVSYRPREGSAVAISVYAFGIGDQYLTPAQHGNRARLRSVLDTLSAPLNAGSAWSPTRLRVFEIVGQVAGAVHAWPAAAPLEKVFTSGEVGSRCGVVEGATAAAVVAEIGGQPARSAWRSGGRTQMLAIGVLVPGQSGCPA